jgi:frataxin-like iron-binding protein CyaY
MSNDNLYSQIYNEIVGGMHLEGVPFQLIGTPKDFVFAVPPTGQMDPSAYQIISGMPQWSPIGNYSSKDAQFFDAVKSVFEHVTFKVSPEMQADQKRLQDQVTEKSNAIVKANSDMNQAYLSSKQNGGLIFAAKYPDIGTWLNNAPEAKAYNNAIANAEQAYQRALDLKLELEKAAMPSTLQDAINAMQAPQGDPASMTAPVGWTKVAGGDGIVRFQPEWKIDTTGGDWRAALTQGSQGAFTIDLSQSDQSASFEKSWAGGSAGIEFPFWGVNGSGGWEKSDMFNQDSSVKVKITVQSSTRVKVNPGDWYPGGFLAELAANAQGTSGQGYTIVAPWVANGGAGSSSLFGQFGIAGTRVAELVLVYKPSFEITMSANTYQQNKQKFEASGGLRIGPFTFGGSGGHESEFTKSTATQNTFSGGSTSENPQIIGVIVAFPGTNAA